MRAARGVCLLLGFALAGLYVISVVSFWAGIYGPVGLFGSMLTLPFSTLVATYVWLFQSWSSFLITAGWIGLSVMFLTIGSQE